MSNTSSTKQKGGQTTKKSSSVPPSSKGEEILDNVKVAVKSEWDYKVALLVITILAFVTRFWGINHPNEVVFDEVHFGKVRKPVTAASASRNPSWSGDLGSLTGFP